MQRTAAHAVASKHGDKGLQLAACITTHMHSLPLDSTPPSQPLRRQAAPNGKRHKLRQNAFFTRQNESREQRKGEMQSQVVISDIGEQRVGRGGREGRGNNPLVLQRGRQSQHQSSRRQSVESKCLMSEEERGLDGESGKASCSSLKESTRIGASYTPSIRGASQLKQKPKNKCT